MRSIPFARVHSSLRAVVFACIASAGSTAFAADEVVTDCSSDAELRADLQAMQDTDGGLLTFSCPESTIVLTADLPVITKGVTIQGGGTITISGNDARRIFVESGGLLLEQLTLTNGFATGEGGAILSQSGVVLHEVLIRDSVATLGGGALSASSAVIQDSEFDSNKALRGGAIFAQVGGLSIHRTWIHDNEATGADDGWGGGLYLSADTEMLLQDSIVSGNSAQKCGGGIYSVADLAVQDSRIVDNVCKSGDGAGLHLEGDSFSLSGSEVSSNSTPGGGGGLSQTNGDGVSIIDSTFAENSSGDRGGAILMTNSSALAVANSTFSSNDAVTAGAMRIENTFVAMASVTVASNEGGGDGAVDYIADGDFALVLQNVLLSDNQEPNLLLAGSGGADITSAGGNVSDDDSASATLTLPSDIRSASTLLGPLGPNGGPTRTHVPQPGSDALDAGESAGNDPDQRGIARPQGLAKDSGAVEVVPCIDDTVLCGDGNDNGAITSNDALNALRASVGSGQCGRWICDYNGSGDVTSTDALLILRAAVGLETSPDCPPVWDCYL